VSLTFVVEQAGCASCAARVRGALEPLAEIQDIEVDEQADATTVRLTGDLSEEAVNEALQAASHGSGHAYRVRPGSWQPAD
jgi:copper chaperone CopZ